LLANSAVTGSAFKKFDARKLATVEAVNIKPCN